MRARFVGNTMAARFGPARVLIQHFGGGPLGGRSLGAPEALGAGAFLGKHFGSPLWTRTGSYPAFRGRSPSKPRSGGLRGHGGGRVSGEALSQSALGPHGFLSNTSGEVP